MFYSVYCIPSIVFAEYTVVTLWIDVLLSVKETEGEDSVSIPQGRGKETEEDVTFVWYADQRLSIGITCVCSRQRGVSHHSTFITISKQTIPYLTQYTIPSHPIPRDTNHSIHSTDYDLLIIIIFIYYLPFVCRQMT